MKLAAVLKPRAARLACCISTFPRVAQALQQATLLELFPLSTLIDRLMAASARTAQILLRLHLGPAVHFLDWRDPQMPLRSAKAVALAKDRTSVLEDRASRQWHLPYAAIEPSTDGTNLAPAPATAAAPTPRPVAQSKRDNFRSGDKVVFEDRLLQPHVGTVVGINRQAVTINADDGKAWRASFGLLRIIVDV